MNQNLKNLTYDGFFSHLRFENSGDEESYFLALWEDLEDLERDIVEELLGPSAEGCLCFASADALLKKGDYSYFKNVVELSAYCISRAHKAYDASMGII